MRLENETPTEKSDDKEDGIPHSPKGSGVYSILAVTRENDIFLTATHTTNIIDDGTDDS